MAEILHPEALERVARLLGREARLLGRCGDADDAAAARLLAGLLADPGRLATALERAPARRRHAEAAHHAA